jgi:hypothetical protein
LHRHANVGRGDDSSWADNSEESRMLVRFWQKVQRLPPQEIWKRVCATTWVPQSDVTDVRDVEKRREV